MITPNQPKYSNDPPSELNKPKRSPSTRISSLVSRFEPPKLPIESTDSQRTASTLHLPAKPTSLARSWSKLEGGRVERNVRRFSTDNLANKEEQEPPSKPQSRRRTSVKSLGYVSGSVDGMDWTPRTKPLASTSAPSATPLPPPPAARFRHPHLVRDAVAKSTALLSGSAPKTTTANTVLVPASVSGESSSSNPKTKVTISIREKSQPQPRNPSADFELEGPTIDSDFRKTSTQTSINPPPLLPSHSSFDSISSTAPSFATSEATLVARTQSRPSLEHRKTSLTFADSINPFEVPPGVSTTLSKTLTPDSISTLFPTPSLDLPPSSSLPSRPQLSRGGTSFQTTSSAATHSYPAHEIFARDSAPLHLPDLDKVLEELGGPPEFSHPPVDFEGIEKDNIEMEKREKGGFGSKEERKSWNEWVRGKPPSLWKRLTKPRDSDRDDQERLIKGESTSLSKEQYSRSLIFPPFHRLPPNATLSDLKLNIRKPPPLYSGNAILQTAADGALNIFGSAAGIRLTTIEGLRDLMQMITLLSTSASPSLSLLTVSAPSSPHSVTETSILRTLFITVPSALSLDFASAFGQALLFLFVLTFFAFLALYEFYRFTGGWKGPCPFTGGCSDIDLGEGYDREDLHVRKTKLRDRKSWKTFITFFLTTIYLPLSKLSFSALFWEKGYWPSELFGTGSKNDRCFKTIPTNGGGGFNAAIVLFPTALLVLGLLAVWFPIRMYKVVQGAKPTVDKWTELGELRRDKKGEYERLLDKDPSPFSFLYREYRREWASFRAIYMLVKLVNVFIIVLISSDNCVFLNFDPIKLDVIRQGTLFAFMSSFFLLDVYSRPQLDEISNRSDRISRMGYMLVSLFGLLVALKVPGQNFFDGSAIVLVNAFSYSFNIYFTIIGTQFARRIVKRVQRRLDFSIDIFSPNLDLSKHISRRIWQETFSTLFLTAPEFAMDADTKLNYGGSPPYLLNFHGSVAERHAENLKILREIGLDAYYEAMSHQNKPAESSRTDELRRILLEEIAGPDVYFRPSSTSTVLSSSITTFFGRLDIIPFPFVAVFRYDQDPSTPLRLSSLEELSELIEQQDLPSVRTAKKVRLVLRALEDELIYFPRIETRSLESSKGLGFAQQITYSQARIKIERNTNFIWQGYNCSSGFEVTFEWKDGIGINGNNGELKRDFQSILLSHECGNIIPSDFQITQTLATLFENNRKIIETRLPLFEKVLNRHRNYFSKEIESKLSTLSYSFLFDIFANDSTNKEDLVKRLRETEKNENLRNLISNHSTSFQSLRERMKWVTSNKVRAWWFIFWDDLFRRNRIFKENLQSFSPHYNTSICYRPMPRARLESFLNERGFETRQTPAFFSCGFLNQLYFVLDELASSYSPPRGFSPIPIHLSSNPHGTPIHYSSLARAFTLQNNQPQQQSHSSRRDTPSEKSTTMTTTMTSLTTGTGDGTNEDDRDIRTRRIFLFERVLFEEPRVLFEKGQRWKFLEYFVKVRIGKGIKRWLGWTLNEFDDDHKREGRGGKETEEILLDLKRAERGWLVPSSNTHH